MRAALNFNRNKRSICIDLTMDAGRQIVYELAARADVCIQNYRPGVAEHLRLDYDTIRQFNPSLVYCEISAFGFKGPEQHRVGFDIIAQGGGGTMVPGWRTPALPVPVSVPIGDVTGMCLAALGIVSALHHRQRTNEGQRIQTSMLDGVMMQNILRLVAVENDDRAWRSAIVDGLGDMVRGGAGYGDLIEASATGIGGMQSTDAAGIVSNVYYRGYVTADGFIAIGCLNLNQQRRLNEALQLGDPRFDANMNLESPETLERAAAMVPRAEQTFALKTTDEWLEFLDGRSIACGRVLNLLEVFESPHHLENEMIVEYDDPWVGPVRLLGHPIKFDRTPMSIRRAASPSGHETDEVLASLSYSPEKIEGLRRESVVF
jgi:formyl-CoA transferase